MFLHSNRFQSYLLRIPDKNPKKIFSKFKILHLPFKNFLTSTRSSIILKTYVPDFKHKGVNFSFSCFQNSLHDHTIHLIKQFYFHEQTTFEHIIESLSIFSTINPLVFSVHFEGEALKQCLV